MYIYKDLEFIDFYLKNIFTLVKALYSKFLQIRNALKHGSDPRSPKTELLIA